MLNKFSPRLSAVLLALLVTVLWSTSWVLIRMGLQDLPPLSFAGLRYTLAFLCLLPFALRGRQLAPLRRASAGTWLRLIALGVLFYAVTQGAQFLSLFYLPASTTSLVLSCTTILVAFLGAFLLRERPTIAQWAGSAVYLVGVFVYLYPISLPRGEVIGLIAALTCMLANALSSVLGRYVNRGDDLSPLAVTVVSMGIGSVLLLAVGIAVQGLPRLTPANWAIVGWLAVVNSALAYTLWNRTLRVLSAMESSILNNTMLFQIAVLAWLFLGEQLTGAETTGIVLAVIGTLVVQLRRRAVPRRERRRRVPGEVLVKNEAPYAGLWKRFLALLVDTLLFCACFFPITRLVKGVWLMSPHDHRWVRGWLITDPLCLVFLVLMALYFVLLEGLAGVTLGKWLLGLRVVRIDGRRPGLWKSALRNALRLVDSLPTLHILGAILIARSPERARFGDRVAGTRVIRVQDETWPA